MLFSLMVYTFLLLGVHFPTSWCTFSHFLQLKKIGFYDYNSLLVYISLQKYTKEYIFNVYCIYYLSLLVYISLQNSLKNKNYILINIKELLLINTKSIELINAFFSWCTLSYT